MAFNLSDKFLELKSRLERVYGFRLYNGGKTYPAATAAQDAVVGAAFLSAAERVRAQKFEQFDMKSVAKLLKLIDQYKRVQPLNRMGFFAFNKGVNQEYPNNATFWQETSKFGLAVSAIGSVPGPWSLHKEAWADQLAEVGAAAKAALDKAGDFLVPDITWFLKWGLIAALGFSGYIYVRKQLRS
jgi:hypothetical protein